MGSKQGGKKPKKLRAQKVSLRRVAGGALEDGDVEGVAGGMKKQTASCDGNCNAVPK